MAEIGCKKCTSPRCDGCNNFILEKALRQGKFDALMNGNKTIHIAANVRENVKGEWIQHYETTSDNETLPYGWECSLCGRWEMEKQPFCNCGAQMVGGAEDGE